MSDSDVSSALPTDGDRIVLMGTVGIYDYDEIIELQGQAIAGEIHVPESKTLKIFLITCNQPVSSFVSWVQTGKTALEKIYERFGA